MPAPTREELEGGFFARKQVHGSNWPISRSQRRRYQTGLRIARQLAGRRILDFGCGDGTFLALLMSMPGAPELAVGAELDPRDVLQCQRRLGRRGLTFCHQPETEEPAHQGRYDVVFCLDVLEHVV